MNPLTQFKKIPFLPLLIALVLVVVVGIAIIVSAFRGSPPSIRDNSVLALKVSGPPPGAKPATKRPLLI